MNILKKLFGRGEVAPHMSRDEAIQAVADGLIANPDSVALVHNHEDRSAILDAALAGKAVVIQDGMGSLGPDLCDLLRERVRVVIESGATRAPFQDLDPADVAEAFNEPSA